MCSRADFSKFVKAMKCTYTASSFLPDRESIEVWYLALRHFSYSELKSAFATYYPLNTFPPTPADLIRLIVRPTDKTPAQAWSEVLQATRYNSSDKDASDCVDEHTRKIIKGIGGWQVIRNCPPENISFLMKQFVYAYEDSIQNETKKLLPETMRKTMIGYDNRQLVEGRTT